MNAGRDIERHYAGRVRIHGGHRLREFTADVTLETAAQ